MTTITTLPPAPDRSDPDTFSEKGDALLGALATFVSETNTVAGEVNANAATATTQAGLATTNGAAQVALATAQVALATTQANNAANSATASANSALVAGAVAWVSGTTYAIGDTRYSPINFQTYRRTTAGAGTTDPSADSTNWTKALVTGVAAVTTATGMTTLTRTATLLKITPASYGVAVTLPDATTCNVGGPLHIIDNKGAYPVRVLNSAGTLLGFVFGGVVSHVSLIDNSTAAGVWTVENLERVGAVAQLTAAPMNISTAEQCVSLGSGRELLLGRGPSPYNMYGVVYDKTSNAFGSVTLVRTAYFGSGNTYKAVLAGTDKVLVVSCPGSATNFEAVILSISGTTITVNTAATATLSANCSGFPADKGLVAVGSSFVCSFYLTGSRQIRALTVSGTTVTIGAATTLSGTYGNGGGSALLQVSGSVVIAASYSASTVYTEPFTVSGTTLTLGTGTSTAMTSGDLYHFFQLGTRWVVLYTDNNTLRGGVVSLSGTTTTISTVQVFSAGVQTDAICIGNSKVLVLGNQTGNNANILTDTAGTASVGTPVTLSTGTGRVAVYATGTTAVVQDNEGGTLTFKIVDCSGASPVVSLLIPTVRTTSSMDFFSASSYALKRSADSFYSDRYVFKLISSSISNLLMPEINKETFRELPRKFAFGTSYTQGTSDVERWIFDGLFAITKVECVA